MNMNHPPGRWQALLDVLSGPPPNEAVLATRKGKPFWLRHRIFLVGMLTSLTLVIAPEVVNQCNRVPDPSTLQTLEVRILRTDLTSPHLFVELPDGQRRNMEWPADLGLGRPLPSRVWTDAQRESLPGCLATVQGAPLMLTPTDRFRIWTLDCPHKSINIDFSATSKRHAQDLNERLLISLGVLLACSLMNLLVFLREKRGHL